MTHHNAHHDPEHQPYNALRLELDVTEGITWRQLRDFVALTDDLAADDDLAVCRRDSGVMVLCLHLTRDKIERADARLTLNQDRQSPRRPMRKTG